MPTYLITILALIVLAMPALPQAQEAAGEVADRPVTGEPPEETPAAADDADDAKEEGAEDAVEIDDSDLDEQTYEADDDDFVPTEEIPADEPIPFPSNI